MDLIDREKLLESMAENGMWQGDEIEAIKSVPTVEAEPVIHGEWLVSAGGKVCACSVCGDEFDNTCNYDIRKDWKRCPVCETKMG